MPDPEALGAEDRKLVTLARSARARVQASEGAAIRDTDGRTYAAATVDQPSFKLTALQAAVAAALSSGAEGVEAAAVVSGEGLLAEASRHAIRDIAKYAPIILADPRGDVLEVLER